jgi:1-deoxy-D-xylulose-5-phosphate reductoisomerase
MKRLAILGSTGSIGTQVLDVVEANPQLFSIKILTAHNNVKLLIKQALKFKPKTVVVANDEHYDELSNALEIEGIEVYSGALALQQVVQDDEVDMVVAAMVGYAGLLPVVNAIKSGKEIALANKETLVVAGDIITRLCAENNVRLMPIDSEHSAIFQCLEGERKQDIDKIILTCSGGPFRDYSYEALKSVTSKQALAHPNWDMGAKITIDSATLMNKGFEVIEAKWLFKLAPEKIEVVVHPQSIVHSMIQFVDGSIKAQMGLPDMRLPIQHALCYPDRIENNFPRLSFSDYSKLTFHAPDTEKFRNLALAYQAIEKEGNMACIMNAANEVVVKAFLQNRISFLQMPEVIEQSMQKISFISRPSIDDYIETDRQARHKAEEIIKKIV